MMQIQEAIQNIDNLISVSRLTRQEHIALSESVKLIMARCKLADELEKEQENGEKLD